MHASSTRHLTVLICSCGCRVADPDKARAYRLMAQHESRAQCSTSAHDIARRQRG